MEKEKKTEQPSTIQELVELLQYAVQKANPHMGVTVNIGLTPKWIEVSDETPITIKEKAKDKKPVKLEPKAEEFVDLEGLRAILNAFAKKNGAEKAKALVKGYTSDKSLNPAKIPEDKYTALLGEIGEIEPKGKDAA